MEWKSTQNSQGNKPSWLSGNPSISPKIQLEGSKHQVAHHLWQLLEPPEGNFFWRCVLQPTSLESFSAALESCWFLWNGSFLWEICIMSDRSVHHLRHEELVTDSCNSCGSTGPGSMWDACCYFQNMLKYVMFSIPNFVIKVTHLSFPNQRISHSLPPRFHKLNAPTGLQKFGHCRLENPPRKRPPKGMCATTVVILLMFSCLVIVSGSESFCPYECCGASDDVLEYKSLFKHMCAYEWMCTYIYISFISSDDCDDVLILYVQQTYLSFIVCNTRLCQIRGHGYGPGSADKMLAQDQLAPGKASHHLPQ